MASAGSRGGVARRHAERRCVARGFRAGRRRRASHRAEPVQAHVAAPYGSARAANGIRLTGGTKMAIIGQPIDRVDGRLKVTGRAKYAAEFAVPGVVHAVLVQSTIGAGVITGFDIGAAQSLPGVLAIITPQSAPKLAMKGGTQQAVHAPLLQDMN